jgi:hypothetical protein
MQSTVPDMPEVGELTPALDGAREQLSRLCDRLRTAPESRLTRRDDRLGGRSLAEATYDVVQWAATTQGVAAPVPALHALATGDLLAVVGREFLDWLDNSTPTNSTPTNSTPTNLAPTLEQWRQKVEELRAVA